MRHTDAKNTAGSTVRRRRKERHLSLDELGHRTEIERTRLCRFELGYTALHEDELRRLAKALGLRMKALTTRARRGKSGTATGRRTWS